MKGMRVSVCLILTALFLLPFVCIMAGAPVRIPAGLPTMPRDAAHSRTMNTADSRPVAAMSPSIEWQWISHMIARYVHLLLIFFVQGAFWKKARFTGICLIMNNRFAVESKTSHPQQAPPVLVQAFA